MSDSLAKLHEGFAYHQAGRLRDAERLYRQVVSESPQMADGWHLLGVLLHQQGQHADGAKYLQQSVRLSPGSPTMWNHLGAAQGAAQDFAAAEASFRKALELTPQDAEVHYNLAALLVLMQRPSEGEAEYKAAIALAPDMASAYYNLGNLLRDSRRLKEAAAMFQKAVTLQPQAAGSWNNLGSTLQQLGRLNEAATALQRALQIQPHYPRAECNLGVLLTEQGKLTEAEALFRRLLSADANFAEAHNNLGVALMHQGRLAEAEAAVQAAIAVQSDYAEAQKNLAVIWLFQGDLARGFRQFEWRFRSKDYCPNPYSQPEWDGLPLDGQTILLHAEQGMGDTIQFVRFAKQVKARGGRVVLRCVPAITRLLSRTPGVDAVFGDDASLPHVEVQASLVSLPAILGCDVGMNQPYVAVEPERVAKWRGELSQYKGLRIGINWQGNPAFRGDQTRSIPLAAFAPVAKLPNVTLLSLQKQHGLDQLAQVAFPIVDLAARLDVSGGAFLDTAAVMQSLDLVITSDTATAHLAGALGVPTIVALAKIPEWRWQLERSDTPWYPSVSLFRQTTLGDWDEVFRRIAEHVTQTS
jgi:tetratricopeptide (TPR) repeat protein